MVTLLVSSSVVQPAQVEQKFHADSSVQKAFTRCPHFLCLAELKLLPIQDMVNDQMVDIVSALKLVTLKEGHSNGQTVLYSLCHEK